ncbi:MAG TPA: NAD(P)-dependent oxidoreductase [Dehalococcoidia bacterium]|jgi:3-hydroxyisobutyrate dehydrogenase-like beta-hydroxyacid dehydrogenase|nr:NAD(P)-dependent oxidoreductase [Dehalococcoidia bacterium]
MNVGFIGLGRMGNNMARNLAEKGHKVTVYDVRPDVVAQMSEIPGITGAKSIAEAAAGAEIVGTSLPGPKEVEPVVLAAGGLLEAMQPGTTYVDLSTNSPTLMRKLHAELAKKGIGMLDAPVSGGVTGAEAGTLSIMVGGDKALFEKVKPFLACIGSEDKIYHCGDVGAGDVCKLCNNLVGIAVPVISAEVLTLGVKAGVDLKTLVEVIGVSTGSNRWITGTFPRTVFRRQFEPAFFSAALSSKDTHLALDLAEEVGIPMAMGSVVGREFEYVLDQGWAELNFDAVVRAQEDRTGIQLALPEDRMPQPPASGWRA